MKKTFNKVISFVLAVIMLCNTISMVVFAVEENSNRLPLEGLNVLCLGDSITAGQGLTAATRWTNVLASKYGWTLTNKSQGGISLSSYYYTANGITDVSIAKKAEILKTMTTPPDVIIVWGGHNDTSYRASPLGTWDDVTTDSFKGALKHIAELTDEYAPDAMLFVLTPLWNNEKPSTLKVPENTADTNWMFVDAIYEGAEKYGWIPINMDLCGITPYNKTEFLLDNIHPNAAGTEKIVEYLSEELANCGRNSKQQTILFNKSSVSVEVGKSLTLKAVLSPRSGNSKPVFAWSSSNTAVAIVNSNGEITSVAHGNAIVTTTADNGISATVRVVVTEGEHTYTPTTTTPTCTEQGYTTHTCCVCGDSYVDSYVEATGHSFGEWYTVTEATPTEPGEERRDCENCEHYETQEIPPKGYEIGDINLDGKVDVMDAYYIRLVVAKLRKPTEQQVLLGDVEGDGKITAIDANIIRKFVVKIITSLPVEQ